MGRHRNVGAPKPGAGRYVGAGKRKKATNGRNRSGGSHRAADSRQRTITIPQVAGAIAMAGAIGGSLATSSTNATGALAAADRAGRPLPSQASIFAGRAVSASRSESRSPAGANVARLDRLVARRTQELERLGRQADRRAREIEIQRWMLPLTSYRLTGRFGDRSSLWSTVHTGLDFAAATGTPIQAVASGEVTEAGWAGPYGLRTIVLLPDGTEVWYCHQSRLDVNVGEAVRRGERIGAVGSTGNVTGPHLHLEVRPGGGTPVDPMEALAQHGANP